jgi:predicted  nucleic acid-binding Zn-ribbon protein
MVKYENLISDLSTVESQITILKNQYADANKRIKELDIALEKSKQDNTTLYQKIAAMEEEINFLKNKTEQGIGLNAMDSEERESLKVRLQELIKRINYHMSPERQA